MTHHIGIGPNLRKSAYFDATVRDGVRSFSVYNHMLIPGHFGEPEAEYDRLMRGVAMWDVGAQRQVQLQGRDSGKLAQYLTPRNLSKTKIGQGRYVPLCDHDGWLINDPVLLKLDEDRYWLSAADSDIHLWAADVSPLAIQGPLAEDVVAKLFGEHIRDFKYFGFAQTELDGIALVLARSGWSKQGGFELYLQDSDHGTTLWDKVKAAGQDFGIGPGAPNDTERLESGLISYGADMRLQTHRANPFEMGMGALVDLTGGHDFVGKHALAQVAKAGAKRTRVGLVIKGTPTPPGHQVPLLFNGAEVGFVSEFAYSKRVDQTIGVGLMRADLAGTDQPLGVAVGPMEYSAALSPIPFV
jgi:glycine cleavage system aminomethyltransferase T